MFERNDMKLFDGKADNKDWLKRGDEEVFIVFPRKLNDGSLRMMETVRRRPVVEYGYSRYDSVRSATRCALKGGRQSYDYYSIEDSTSLVERAKNALKRLVFIGT